MKFSEGLRKGLAIREKLGRPYCAAVIVAAGSSSRMGGTNKILTVLEKLPVICRTVDAFDRCSLIDEIIVVTQKDLMEKVSRYLAAYGKMRMVVAGGETRRVGQSAARCRPRRRTASCDRRSHPRRRRQGKEIRRRSARCARQGHHQGLDRRCGRRHAGPQHTLRRADPAGI